MFQGPQAILPFHLFEIGVPLLDILHTELMTDSTLLHNVVAANISQIQHQLTVLRVHCTMSWFSHSLHIICATKKLSMVRERQQILWAQISKSRYKVCSCQSKPISSDIMVEI